MNTIKKLPAVHLWIQDLETVEKLLRENTTNCRTAITLSLSGGVEKEYHSLTEINVTTLDNIGGSNSYVLSASGEEGECTIAGESDGTESHVLYCEGDPDWESVILSEIPEYIESIQTDKSRLRDQLVGQKVAVLATLAALFAGWALPSIAPQPLVHYYPTLSDGFVFSLGLFGLSVLRFRNWIHPYVRVGSNHSYPTERRILSIVISVVVFTSTVLLLRFLLESGPLLN